TIALFKSSDGGATWSQTRPVRIHADQHGFAFIPANPNGFYLGNDGGVYKSLDGNATFINLNQALPITQFMRGAVHPSNITSALGGTQDNGSLSYESSINWYRSAGSDGGYAAVDYNNPSTVYVTAQNLAISKSTSGPRGIFSPATTGIPDSSVE